MTLRQAFTEGVASLRAAEHPTTTPELDARVLLAHAAGLSSAQLLSRWNDALGPAEPAWREALRRRLDGEPVAWIVGVQEFWGLDFEVGPGLLVPRADTETLVQAALDVWAELPEAPVVDVCTGTGCVAIALAASAPGRPFLAIDLSPVAVETARRNAARLVPHVDVRVCQGDLLAGQPGPWSLIVSNPPYLTADETHERVNGGWREPALALNGGPDGLDLVRRLVGQAAPGLTAAGWLLIEAADAQMDAIAGLLVEAGGTSVRWWKDLAGQRRVVGARWGLAKA